MALLKVKHILIILFLNESQHQFCLIFHTIWLYFAQISFLNATCFAVSFFRHIILIMFINITHSDSRLQSRYHLGKWWKLQISLVQYSAIRANAQNERSTNYPAVLLMRV